MLLCACGALGGNEGWGLSAAGAQPPTLIPWRTARRWAVMYLGVS